MDELIFKSHFPAFPQDPEELQKFSTLLLEKNLLTQDELNQMKTAHPDPSEWVREVALKETVQPKDLALVEASILNIPFVDLEATQIPTDVMKLFKPEIMVEYKVIPIKLTGQELLVGMIAPASTDPLKILGQTNALAMRPGKILLSHFELKLKQFTDKKSAVAKKSGARKRLGDVLVESKFLTPEQIKEALETAKKEKLRIGAYLVKKGLLTNKQLSIALSRQFEIPFIDLEENLFDPVIASLLPKKMCYDKTLCPVKKEDTKLIVAFADPTDIITIDHIEMMTGLRVSAVVSSELSIVSALDKMYGAASQGITEEGDGMEPNKAEDLMGDLDQNAAPIIKLVNLVFTQAVTGAMSDIHIEPFENELRIRYRKDGVMRIFMKTNKAATPAVLSRIKVMSNLDIAETRKPQDGRIKLNLGGRKIDVRVSIVPVVWGEKVCMRLCDQGNLKVNMTDLGFEPFVLEKFNKGVKSPNGIVLVTGPTGSGKTTTLYSALFLLNSPGINIMTAEDPVEYNLMGINQVQCHPDIGLDFSAALRSFLRQDPNVIMIGEIRDFETASIAIKAAMTGHMVISTLHTNDAPATVARLINMGVEPFAVTSSVRIVEAQRLVRKICKSCYTEFAAPPDMIKTLGITPAMIKRLQIPDIDHEKIIFAKGAGCPDCENSGYKGRQGIYEVLEMTETFRAIIENKGTPEDMRRQAMRDGMLSLRESALYKLLSKKTTVDEVVRATMEGGPSKEESAEDLEKGLPPVSVEAIQVATGQTPGAPQIITAAPGMIIPQSSTIAVPAIDSLAMEMQAFRNAIDKISSSQGSVVNIANEALRQNLTDPLTQMQNQVRSGMSGGDLSKLLPSIHAQGQKMDFNLKNLVFHFSTPAWKIGSVKLNDLVERDIMTLLKQHVMLARLLSGTGTIGSNLKVTKNLQNNLPNVLIDPEAFASIAMNLIVNSLMAMPNGGEIKIVTRLKPGSTKIAELAILDSGVGIPAEKQQNLFSPFVPIGRKTLGLGLAVVKKLVTGLGGQVSLKSTSGKSTLVVVEFPCAA